MLPKDVTEHEPIFERELTTRRPAGSQILAVAIVQLDTSEWIIKRVGRDSYEKQPKFT